MPTALSPQNWLQQLDGALRSSTCPAELRADLMSGVDNSAWAELLDERGRPFATFAEFCAAPRPYGLATPEEDVRHFLNALIGPRAAGLVVAPPARQGRRTDLDGTSARGGRKSGHQRRLRAIAKRASPEVRDLYARGVLIAEEAAYFAPKSPTETQARAAQAFLPVAREILVPWGCR